MNKKLVALCLCVAILAGALTAGTLAYFTDKEQVTNTMTLGNVEINIDEYQLGADGYEEFEDNDFTLYPVSLAEGRNLRNKVVYTANVSESQDDAYIRTIVLFEKNDLIDVTHTNEGNCCFKGIHYNQFNSNNEVQISNINGKRIHSSIYTELENTVTVNGEEYWVAVLEEANHDPIKYDEALYSISAVYIDKNVTSEQIAGWADVVGEDENGNDIIENKVDVIVFSQGIQTTGLTYAQAMAELGTVDQDLIDDLFGEDDAVINDWN